MSGKRWSLDTNILVYSVDLDAGARHDRAIELFELLTPDNCVLSLQSLSEFYAAVTRKKLMPMADAMAQIDDWQQLFPVVAAKGATLTRALAGVKRYQLSFWDALLWATVREARVDTLLSEDFQHEQLLEGVQIINPFKFKDIGALLA
ncbi:MAG: PIN domain-containing protein [Betaproteobacteria bacterium]|nr:PIN domain-containing protein [Betaproteobacteria bacterium]